MAKAKKILACLAREREEEPLMEPILGFAPFLRCAGCKSRSPLRCRLCLLFDDGRFAPRRYERWGEDEKEFALVQKENGWKVEDIAWILGRTPQSVKVYLCKLMREGRRTVMRILDEVGEASLAEICALTGLSRGQVEAFLSDLSRKGWVCVASSTGNPSPRFRICP